MVTMYQAQYKALPHLILQQLYDMCINPISLMSKLRLRKLNNLLKYVLSTSCMSDTIGEDTDETKQWLSKHLKLKVFEIALLNVCLKL